MGKVNMDVIFGEDLTTYIPTFLPNASFISAQFLNIAVQFSESPTVLFMCTGRVRLNARCEENCGTVRVPLQKHFTANFLDKVQRFLVVSCHCQGNEGRHNGKVNFGVRLS